MSDHGTASMSTGQFAEFAGAVTPQLPRNLSHDSFRFWMDNRHELKETLAAVFLERRATVSITVPSDSATTTERIEAVGFHEVSEVFKNPIPALAYHMRTLAAPSGNLEIELFSFGCPIRIMDANFLLGEKSSLAVDLHGFLALGAERESFQLTGFVVPFDHTVYQARGPNLVPVIRGTIEGKRDLLALNPLAVLPPDTWFAAIAA